MNQKKIYEVVDVIHRNGAIKKLIHIGFNYSEVAEILEYLIENKFVIETDEKVLLSKIGIEFYNKLSKEHKQRNKEYWIKHHEESMIKILDKNTIFVPDQNELDFDQD